MARVLWLSNETPDQHGQGGQRRQFFQVRELALAGHRVTVCTLAGPQDDTRLREHATVVRTRPRWRGRVPRPGHRRLLDRLAHTGWDAVVVAHTESWPTFRRLVQENSAPCWVDLHNVLGMDISGARTVWADVERDIGEIADVVSVCSQQERARLLDQQPAVRAHVTLVNHGIDPDEWRSPRTPAPSPVVKLFGNWAWAPNARGLEWFLSEVWRSLDIAGARCEIAGSGVTLDEGLANVTFVGRVPALDAWTSDAWAIAVPVVGGVGAPVKYLEALATGAPVLSTPDGAPTAREAATLVSMDARQWVTALQELLSPSVGPTDTHVDASMFSWRNATSPLLGWLEGR